MRRKGESAIRKSCKIHPTAVVEKDAKLGEDVEIGPYSIIGSKVEIGDGTKIGSSVVIEGWTTIGRECRIFHGAVIGTPPQDTKYNGEKTFVRIGDGNIIREFVTIHRASGKGQATLMGDENFLMAYVHIAHNSKVGNRVVIANSSSLSGHVEVEDQAVIGGMTGFHQFVRVGRLAMVGGYSRVVKDAPPFFLVSGQPARLYGLNKVGLRRNGVPKEVRQDLKTAFRLLCRFNRLEAIEEIRKRTRSSEEIEHLIRFLEAPSRMGVILRTGEDLKISPELILGPSAL